MRTYQFTYPRIYRQGNKEWRFQHLTISVQYLWYKQVTVKRKFDNRTTQYVLINHIIHSTYLSKENILTSISLPLRINNVGRGGDNYSKWYITFWAYYALLLCMTYSRIYCKYYMQSLYCTVIETMETIRRKSEWIL